MFYLFLMKDDNKIITYGDKADTNFHGLNMAVISIDF